MWCACSPLARSHAQAGQDSNACAYIGEHDKKRYHTEPTLRRDTHICMAVGQHCNYLSSPFVHGWLHRLPLPRPAMEACVHGIQCLTLRARRICVGLGEDGGGGAGARLELL